MKTNYAEDGKPGPVGTMKNTKPMPEARPKLGVVQDWFFDMVLTWKCQRCGVVTKSLNFTFPDTESFSQMPVFDGLKKFVCSSCSGLRAWWSFFSSH